MKHLIMNTAGFQLAAAAAAAAAIWAGPAVAGENDEVKIITRGAVVRGDSLSVDWSKDNHVIEIRVENGDISVKIDGKEIPPNRIRKKGARIVILDNDGNELKSLGLFLGPDDEGFEFDWNGPMVLTPFGTTRPEAQPEVMIGVHMSEPGEALRKHLRLGPGETTMISGLYEGLPAHRAGLEQHDIIVAVDGRRPADPTSVREALADKEPGDDITFTVIHEGRTRQYDVTLVAFDASRMDPSRLIGGSVITERDIEIPLRGRDWRKYLVDPGTRQFFRRWFDEDRWPRQLEQELTEALRDRLPPDLDDRLQQLNDRIGEVKEMIDMLVEQARELTREGETRRDREE